MGKLDAIVPMLTDFIEKEVLSRENSGRHSRQLAFCFEGKSYRLTYLPEAASSRLSWLSSFLKKSTGPWTCVRLDKPAGFWRRMLRAMTDLVENRGDGDRGPFETQADAIARLAADITTCQIEHASLALVYRLDHASRGRSPGYQTGQHGLQSTGYGSMDVRV